MALYSLIVLMWRCAVKKLLTHSLTHSPWRCICFGATFLSYSCLFGYFLL